MARVRITGHADYNPHANYSGQVSDGSLDRDPKISTKMKPVDESEANSGIYKITNLVNNKCYIGSAVDYKRRINSHFNNKNLNKILTRAFNKYGKENFTFNLIEKIIVNSAEDYKYLLDREQYYLDSYGAKEYVDNKNKRFLKQTYNICPTTYNKLSGDLKYIPSSYGRRCSEETKINIGKKAKIRLSDPTKNPNYGKKVSKETKQRVLDSFIKSGNMYNFYKIDKNLNVVGPLINISAFCRDNKYTPKGIHLCFSEICRTYKGFAWCKEEDLEKRISQIKAEPRFFEGKRFQKENTTNVVFFLKNIKTNEVISFTSAIKLYNFLGIMRKTYKKYRNTDKIFNEIYKIIYNGKN